MTHIIICALIVYILEDEMEKKKEKCSKNFVWKGHTQIDVIACRLFGCYQKVISFCCYDYNSYRIFY